MLSINTESQLVNGYIEEGSVHGDAKAVERSGPSWTFRKGKAPVVTNGEGGPTASFRLRKHPKKHPAAGPTVKAVKDTGVNLRDVGATTGQQVKAGALFRSSELLGKKQMSEFGIKTILDLRRMDRPCKNKKDTKLTVKLKTLFNYLLKGPNMVVPDVALPHKARAFPKTCAICSDRFEARYGLAMTVQHADLIPGLVGFRIFQAMPKRVRLQAVFAGLRGQGAASVMAPAVANPLLMGYKALYRTMLEDSKRGIARALRVFVPPEAFPVLVHCIHGKDRTGLIIALLLMICDVDPQVIVSDYVQSEEVLKASRMHDELDLDVYLTTNDVIAATRDTMEDTIAFINDKYGSAHKYCKSIGLESEELAQIRINLMKQAGVQDLLNRKRPPRPSILRFSRPSMPVRPDVRSPLRQTQSTGVRPLVKQKTAPAAANAALVDDVLEAGVEPSSKSDDALARGEELDRGVTRSLPSTPPGVEATSPRISRSSFFRRSMNSRSMPSERSGRSQAASSDHERDSSPTGGRFTAGWMPSPQPGEEPAEPEEPVGELRPNLASRAFNRISNTLGRPSHGLSRPSHSAGEELGTTSARFEDLDTPTAPEAMLAQPISVTLQEEGVELQQPPELVQDSAAVLSGFPAPEGSATQAADPPTANGNTHSHPARLETGEQPPHANGNLSSHTGSAGAGEGAGGSEQHLAPVRAHTPPATPFAAAQ